MPHTCAERGHLSTILCVLQPPNSSLEPAKILGPSADLAGCRPFSFALPRRLCERGARLGDRAERIPSPPGWGKHPRTVGRNIKGLNSRGLGDSMGDL